MRALVGIFGWSPSGNIENWISGYKREMGI